jgi:hypothetical protein
MIESLEEVVETAESEEVPEHHRVLIAAAAAFVFGNNARLRGIRPAGTGSAWTRQGRKGLLSSHNFRSRGRKPGTHDPGAMKK